jgi:dTDP-4-amino-4,6-dideoxygalactose transaminase
MILVTKPYIPKLSKVASYIKKANQKEWLTNFGPLHQELTHRLEDYLGVKNLLLVSNGTLALQIGYKSLGIKGKALTTPYSFLATSSSMVWENIKPQFIDIERSTLSINPKLLPEKPGKDVSGMVAVHVYGNPSKTSKLDSYCKEHKIKMLYDGAHAFGIKKNNKSVLLAGDATTLSLHATKIFHTVEGGAIIFKDRAHFEKAKQLTNFGYDDKKDIKEVGINCKLNEYSCAVGLSMLDEIDSIIDRRVSILQKYYDKLKDYVEIPEWDSKANFNGAYAPVLMKNEEELLNMTSHLEREGVQTRRYFNPSLNQVSLYGRYIPCPVSEDISSRVLALPIYTSMTDKEQNVVIKNFTKFYRN